MEMLWKNKGCSSIGWFETSMTLYCTLQAPKVKSSGGCAHDKMRGHFPLTTHIFHGNISASISTAKTPALGRDLHIAQALRSDPHPLPPPSLLRNLFPRTAPVPPAPYLPLRDPKVNHRLIPLHHPLLPEALHPAPDDLDPSRRLLQRQPDVAPPPDRVSSEQLPRAHPRPLHLKEEFQNQTEEKSN
ncbi:hypothetical protein C1H46_025095 [Malus baccata]|uniref:Uncharacterized protein n=1 Tax=Malus baccata TaxID=106549 RepID=A0A540LS92_MALBA|nr:hypothetical protein C1H46_025095 [Malus baccata]